MVPWAKGVFLIHAAHRIHHLQRISLEEWKDAGRERTAVSTLGVVGGLDREESEGGGENLGNGWGEVGAREARRVRGVEGLEELES